MYVPIDSGGTTDDTAVDVAVVGKRRHVLHTIGDVLPHGDERMLIL